MASRVQVSDLRQPQAVQQIAQPVDTYVRPHAAPITPPAETNPLLDLVDALGEIRPALQAYAEKQRQDDIAAGNAEAARQWYSRSFEENRRLRESGQLYAHEDPFVVAALRRVYGRDLAIQTANRVRAAYLNSADRDNLDINQMLADAASEAMAGMDHPSEVNAFTEAWDPLQLQIIDTHNQFLNNRTTEQIRGSLVGELTTLTTDSGLPADEWYRRARGMIEEWRSLGVDYGTADDIMVASIVPILIQNGDVERLELLLNDTSMRNGAPSIASKPGIAANVMEWMALASGNRLRREAVAAAYNALQEGGSVGFAAAFPRELTDSDGDTLFTPEELMQQGIQQYLAESARMAETETPEQTFDREMEWFTARDLVHPRWEAMLNTAGTASYSALAQGERADEMVAVLNLYRNLRAKSDGMLRQMGLTEEARTFLDAADIGVTYLGMSPEEAIVNAATAISRTDIDPMTEAEAREEIRKNLESDLTGAFSFFQNIAAFFSDIEYDEVLYPNLVATEISRVAVMLERAGLDRDDAVTLATERFLKTHTEINNHWVYTGDQRIPADFSEVVEYILDRYASAEVIDEETGEAASLGIDASDLTLITLPGTSGVWYVARTDQGYPIPLRDEAYQLVPVTLDSINLWRGDMVLARRLEAEEMERRAQEEFDRANNSGAFQVDPFAGIAPGPLPGTATDMRPPLDPNTRVLRQPPPPP